MSVALAHSDDSSNEVVTIMPLVTAEQLAEILQVSTRTVWRMRSAGQLPKPVRIGGNVRWRAQDVASWITGGCMPNRLGSEA